MQVAFSKYHGTGNDFIIIDNRALFFPKDDVAFIEHLCHRRFGVGADGLMLVENAVGFDFRMVYFNADGRPSTMCGNGGRCITAFAIAGGMAPSSGVFIAVDGPHAYSSTDDGQIRLGMKDVSVAEATSEGFIMDTGSPHYVAFVEDVDACDMVAIGRSVRYSDRFKAEGINVNVVQPGSEGAKMRTYERGVEDETYSCGTGTVAAALAIALRENLPSGSVALATKGGQLEVFFHRNGNHFSNIILAGPAVHVFEGTFQL